MFPNPGATTKVSPERSGAGLTGKRKKLIRRIRLFLPAALVIVSAGTFWLGRYIFSGSRPASASLQVMDCGVITGRRIFADQQGATQYSITFRRPDQSLATRTVPLSWYNTRQNGQTVCFFEPSFAAGGPVMLFLIGIVSVFVLGAACPGLHRRIRP
jgi:hypothetical protein